MTRKCVICAKHRGMMFRFPNARHGKELVNKWKQAAGWPMSRIPNGSECVCADHFREDEWGETPGGRTVLLFRAECYPTIKLKPKVDVFCEESENDDDNGDDEDLMRCVKCHKNSSQVKVFQFPMKGTVSLKIWKVAAGKSGHWKPSENVGICEHHFALDQFVKNGNIEPGEELELLPDANPADFGKCYICFKNEISRCAKTLAEKSKHSDRTLLQVFETIMNSRVIIPSVGLCNECCRMLNDYEKHFVESHKIQSKIVGFLKARTVDRTPKPQSQKVVTSRPAPTNPPMKSSVTNPPNPTPKPTIMKPPISKPGQVTIRIAKPSIDTMKIESATSLASPPVETKRAEPIIYAEAKKRIVIYPDSSTVINEEIQVESEKVINVVNVVSSKECDVAGPSSGINDDFDDFPTDDSSDECSDSNTNDDKQQDKTRNPESQKELGFGIMKCVICSREYNTTQSFLIHKKLHNVKSEQLDCEVCGKIIEMKMFVTHMSQCFGDIESGLLKCALKTCDMVFETIEELSTHMTNHTFVPKRTRKRRRPQSSENPAKRIRKKSTKTYVKYPNERLPCYICGKLIVKRSMVMHMFSHEKDHLKVKKKEPKYPRKKFKRNGEPYRNKQIPCPVCNKMFDTFKLRTEHQYVHLGYKPHKCPICLRGLSTVKNVKQHIFLKHRQNYEPPDIYICTECPENVRFNTWNELGTHMNETHRKQEEQKDAENEPMNEAVDEKIVT